MLCRSFVIRDRLGLHIRPSSILATELAPFASDALLLFRGSAYNAKSVLRVLAACIGQGSTIQLQVDGPDEEAAMTTAANALIRGGFVEEQAQLL